MIMNSCLTYMCFPDIPYGPVSFLLARNPQDSTSIQEFERYKFLRHVTSFRYSHYESHQTRTQPLRVPLQQVDQGEDGYEAERCLAFASMAEFDHNTRDVGGRTALYLAVFWGWHRATDALLGIPGIDDCCIDDDKYSRLHLVYYWSLLATTEKLIAHGGWKSAFDVDLKRWHPLHVLAKQGLEEHPVLSSRGSTRYLKLLIMPIPRAITSCIQ